MEKPIIALKSPAALTLEKGTYFWCACGRSKNQPFCDGSHRGTGIVTVQLKLEEKKEVFLCRCKHSANKPFCDGTHRTL